MKELYADVAVELPLEGLFSYSVPPPLEEKASPGKRVLVPFGRRKVTGYIVALGGRPGVEETREIIDVLDESPLFDGKRLQFFEWLSSYYFAPLGEALSLSHPAGVNVKSLRYFKTKEGVKEGLGRDAPLPDISETEGSILASAEGGISLSTLLKRLKGAPVCSAIESLKRKGLLQEEVRLRGGGRPRLGLFVSVEEGIGSEALDGLSGSPLQFKVLERLLREGEVSLKDLRRELGGVDRAVRRLEAAGLVRVYERELRREPLAGTGARPLSHEPNGEQKEALDAVAQGINSGRYSPFLLYGVTGSGKTLVYLRAIEEAVRRGKRAVYLVPEIALTPWPGAYLSEMFPGRVAVFHSGLSKGERYDEWRRIRDGHVDVVVGTRSALFLPLAGLGLIIVDEEHDPSYKQEDGVRYNARDCALMLARFLGATVVLGSATPSVETFHNARTGKITPLYLRERVPGASMPDVEVVDMKGLGNTVLSERLKGLLRETLDSGGQAVLFLNRRGFSNFLICRDCGHTFRCLNCSVSLTFHKSARALKCHYCDFETAVPLECPSCRSRDLRDPGLGTEKVEEEIRSLFPGARVGRMDRDTTRRKGAAKRIIDAMEEREVDVLVGTQMVSKGHHFPGITLVGIVSGDTSLNIPDFRSSERTFQLLTQASGRCGRGSDQGMVVVQTLNPGHYCLRRASSHDYDGFFEEELGIRKELDYPPFARLCNIRVEGPGEERVASFAASLKEAADLLRRRRGYGDVSVLGPAPALVSRLRGRYRWHLLVKGRRAGEMHAFLRALKGEFEGKMGGGLSLAFDMDPVTVL